jgi:hypothetical protein
LIPHHGKSKNSELTNLQNNIGGIMGTLESLIPVIARPVCEILIDRLFTGQSGGFSDQSCKGDWHAHWTITQPKNFRPKKIDDLITIKINKKGKVSGEGSNPFYGKYVISGTDMPFAMTLTYQPARGSASYPGICLIL